MTGRNTPGFSPRLNPARERPGLLFRADPRIKIGLALLLGVLTWRAGPVGLVVYAVFLAAILLLTARSRPDNRSVIRIYTFFILFWMALKFGFDLLEGLPWPDAAIAAGFMGFRLLVLVFLGLALALTSSARGLGLALAWVLRPVLRDRAWQAALALALMIHFLPLTWQTLSTVHKTVNLRAADLPFRRRLMLLALTSLRSLSQKTWKQTLALAARKLDGPETWSSNPPFRSGEVLIALVLAAAALFLVYF